jgi:hypothetical protein
MLLQFYISSGVTNPIDNRYLKVVFKHEFRDNVTGDCFDCYLFHKFERTDKYE